MFSGKNKNPNIQNNFNLDKTYLAEQKSILRNDFSKIGLSLLFALVVLYLVSYFLPFITAEKISQSQNTFALANLVNAIASILAFIPAGFFCCAVSKEKIAGIISFSRSKKGSLFYILASSFAFFMLSNYMTNLFLGNMEFIGLPVNQTSSGFEKSLFNFLIYIFCVAVVPAMTEEFLFRGVLLGILKKYGESFAVVTSALLFGLMHHNFVQLPFAFIGGLVFGYITIYTGSLLPAIAVHFANNLFSCVFSALPKYIGTSYSEMIYAALVFASLILGIYSVYKLSANDGRLFFLDNRAVSSNSYLIKSERDKYKYFFQSFGIITFSLLLLGISVYYSFLN